MADDRQTTARQEATRRAAVASGQNLEKAGQVEAALQAFRSVGALDEVARLLITQRRFSEAGRVLLDTLGVAPEAVGTLDPGRRKTAFQAGVCFSRGGDAQLAAKLFVALGERDRAVEILRKAGDVVTADRVAGGGVVPAGPPPSAAPPQSAARPLTVAVAQGLEASGKPELAFDAYVQLRQLPEAARVAKSLGRFSEAGELFTNAGMAFEAAECFQEAGNATRTLAALERVSREEHRYRVACVLALRLAANSNILDFQLDHFLARFLSEPPRDARECEAFYLAAKLFRAHDYLENAQDALRKILAVNPSYRDVRQRLAEMELEARGSAQQFESILREDEAFRQVTARRAPMTEEELPGLPDLPDLPSLPGVTMVGQASSKAPARVPSGGRSILAAPPAVSSAPAAAGGPRSIATYVPPPSVPRAPPPAAIEPAPPPAKAAAPASAVPTVGSVVADRYRLEDRIGQGGMATVYRAYDLELDERIALKLFTQPLDDEQLLGRFKQELSLSRQLLHPNIIRLYDIGSVGGIRFITMELLRGDDLKARLGKPLPIALGVDYLLQACAALQHAHDKGIVHRDIKPANLFLTQEGVVKLMDFGIAKRQATPGLTVSGMIAGTPEYMSPEQINGFDKVTASTDLYALGIMAYEMFTGVVPFRSAELMPLLLMQLKDLPPPPRQRNAAIPPALEKIILQLLEKDPARRPASGRELAAALAHVPR